MFTKELLDKLADRLLIGLTPEENKMVLDEFEVIDRDIAKINNIKGLKEAEPMCWCLDREITSLREDASEESVDVDTALSNSDGALGNMIEIPKVV